MELGAVQKTSSIFTNDCCLLFAPCTQMQFRHLDVVTICPLVVKSIVTTFESDTVVETFLGAQVNFFEATLNTLLYGEHVATPGGDRQGGLEA